MHDDVTGIVGNTLFEITQECFRLFIQAEFVVIQSIHFRIRHRHWAKGSVRLLIGWLITLVRDAHEGRTNFSFPGFRTVTSASGNERKDTILISDRRLDFTKLEDSKMVIEMPSGHQGANSGWNARFTVYGKAENSIPRRGEFGWTNILGHNVSLKNRSAVVTLATHLHGNSKSRSDRTIGVGCGSDGSNRFCFDGKRTGSSVPTRIGIPVGTDFSSTYDQILWLICVVVES